jgi:putative NIF3 family GTP cyclohydrolase 1 type 2
MTLAQCAEHVKACNRLADVRMFGDPQCVVEKAAVCTGSGKSMLEEAIASGAQVYITGDIDHHTALDALARGLNLIDAGHYGTEYIFSEGMKQVLEDNFPQLKITCEKGKCPYTVL